MTRTPYPRSSPGGPVGSAMGPHRHRASRATVSAGTGFLSDLAPEGDRPLSVGLAGVALLSGVLGLSSGWFGAPPPGQDTALRGTSQTAQAGSAPQTKAPVLRPVP